MDLIPVEMGRNFSSLEIKFAESKCFSETRNESEFKLIKSLFSFRLDLIVSECQEDLKQMHQPLTGKNLFSRRMDLFVILTSCIFTISD